MSNDYQICTRCIMDTTDPDITFDEKGFCNHCRKYEKKVKNNLFLDEEGQGKLQQLLDVIKENGKNKDYDCVVGVSGGVDSTFMVYTVIKFGLRPLLVHIDNGWNSELAVRNIEGIVKTLKLNLHTYLVDWEAFKDLQVSFLKASVPDAEIPTDHLCKAVLYSIAVKRGIKYIISGSNVATEGIMSKRWGYGINDWRYIKSVHKIFGNTSLKHLPHMSFFIWMYYTFIKKIQTIRILDYVRYNKRDAMKIIQDKFGWEYYGGKHYESIYTRFLQGYILPRKFNIDKRKAHLSSLICSEQIGREEALKEMQISPYPDENMMRKDRECVIKKLGFTEQEFEKIMHMPPKSFLDYPNTHSLKTVVRNFSYVAKKYRLIPKQWVIDFDL